MLVSQQHSCHGRNGTQLQQWLIDDFISGPDGIDSPAIDGFFFDDNWGRTGASEMDLHNIEDAGLTPADVADMHAAWANNTYHVGQALLEKGGYGVPFFQSLPRNESNPAQHCKQYMRQACAVNRTTGRPNLYSQCLMLEFSRVDHHADIGLWYPNGTLPFFAQDLATFLLVRGPHAYIGYTWSGCTDSGYPSGCNSHWSPEHPEGRPCRFPRYRDRTPFSRPEQLDWDYGVPTGDSPCAETTPGSGVFRRRWTKADVELDCNSFTSKITMKHDDGSGTA